MFGGRSNAEFARFKDRCDIAAAILRQRDGGVATVALRSCRLRKPGGERVGVRRWYGRRFGLAGRGRRGR
jgi:hypothetical protein